MGWAAPQQSKRGALVVALIAGVLAFAAPASAQEPQVCVGGGNDGNACVNAAGCPGGTCTPDDVRAYAAGCYARLGIAPANVPKSFVCKAPTAKQLVLKVQGVIKDINCPKDSTDPNCPAGKPNPNAAAAAPATCDNPTWLPNGDQCYGNSYIQKLTIGSVEGALLCRHKKSWSDGDKDFPDIAIILHNEGNGETCWFQTSDSTECSARPPGVGCDGTNVPPPHTAPAATFWLKPSEAAKINCVRCHDNGPFMNSRWMRDSGVNLEDSSQGKYLNNGYAFSTPANGIKWAETKFVTVGRAGLTDDSALECVFCHKISAAQKTPDPKPAFGNRNFQTFEKWLDYSTGKQFPDGANAVTQSFERAYWMPVEHGIKTAAEWDKTYGEHVKKLKACMKEGAVRAPGSACEDMIVSFNTRPSNKKGASMYASLDGGATFPFVSNVSSGSAAASAAAGLPALIPAGSKVKLGWEADASFHACSIQVTFPEDTMVSSTGVGTASNWALPDSPKDIGELKAPGKYRFDMYCSKERRATLLFEVGPQGAPNCDCKSIDFGLLTGPYRNQCGAREKQLLSLAAEGKLKLRVGPDRKLKSGEFCDSTAQGPRAWPAQNAPVVPPQGVPRFEPCKPSGLIQQC